MPLPDDFITDPTISRARYASNDPKLQGRRRKACQLRNAGMTYNQIGEQLGVSHVAAFQLVKRALNEERRLTQDAVEDLRDIAHRRHENIIARLWSEALPPPQMGSDGKMYFPSAKPLLVKRILDAIRQDAKLMGYAAPERHEVDITSMEKHVGVVIEIVSRAIPPESVEAVHEALQEALGVVAAKEQKASVLLPEVKKRRGRPPKKGLD